MGGLFSNLVTYDYSRDDEECYESVNLNMYFLKCDCIGSSNKKTNTFDLTYILENKVSSNGKEADNIKNVIMGKCSGNYLQHETVFSVETISYYRSEDCVRSHNFF